MMHITLVLCDCILIATQIRYTRPGHETTEHPRLGEDYDLLWSVVCTDSMSGKVATDLWTDAQIQAVVCLGFCGDDHPGLIAERLYPIAEEAIKEWPSAVRPIP